MPSVGEHVEEISSSYLADENAKRSNLLGKQFRSVLKVKYTSIIWSTHFLLRYFPKRNESISPYKDLYVNVYKCFICDSPGLHTSQRFVNQRMEKQSCGLSIQRVEVKRRAWTLDMCNNMNEAWNNYAEEKKLDKKEYILHDLVKSFRKGKPIYNDRKQRSGCLGKRRSGKDESQGHFCGC